MRITFFAVAFYAVTTMAAPYLYRCAATDTLSNLEGDVLNLASGDIPTMRRRQDESELLELLEELLEAEAQSGGQPTSSSPTRHRRSTGDSVPGNPNRNKNLFDTNESSESKV